MHVFIPSELFVGDTGGNWKYHIKMYQSAFLIHAQRGVHYSSRMRKQNKKRKFRVSNIGTKTSLYQSRSPGFVSCAAMCRTVDNFVHSTLFQLNHIYESLHGNR